MKRFLLPLLFLACTLGLICAAEAKEPYCEQCGGTPVYDHDVPVDDWGHGRVCPHGVALEDGRYAHFADCDGTQGICAECGYESSNIKIRHSPDTDNWQFNDTEHWTTCDICGEECYRDPHTSECDSPTVCATCGQTYAGDNVTHSYDGGWQSDDTQHWMLCPKCGTELSRHTHAADCSAPNVCNICGHPYSGDVLVHDWSSDIQSDDNYHWCYCLDCGQESRAEHIAFCDAPDYCIECGHPNPKRILHGEEEFQSDDTYHTLICKDCGAELSSGTHWAFCDAPDICAVCGHDYSGNVSHEYDWDNWQFDDAEHWNVCTRCGEVVDKGEHWERCTEPGVCSTCGHAYSGDDIIHFYYDNTEFTCTATTHSFVCPGCGQYVTDQHEFAEDGVCYYCDYNKNHTHEYVVTLETAPDCETEGSTTYTCTICGDSYSETTASATGHDWQMTDETATCTEDGVTTYTCANCGSQYEETQAKLGHAEWNLVSHTDPTCTADGEDRFACSRCGMTHSRPINATGHSFGAYEPRNDGTHAASCRNCGTLKNEPCTYNEAGVCTVCGAAKPAAEATAAPVIVPAEEAVTVVEIVKEVQEVVAQVQEAVAQAQEAVAQALSVPETAAAQQALLDTIVVTTETLENETVLTVADQTALLPEGSGILRLFTAELNQQEQVVTPEGLVRIRLAWEDDLDIVLYRLTADGELVEVVFEYDAENKVLVFDTDTMGSFVILPRQ